MRRFDIVESRGTVGTYVHGTRIGVLVELEGGNAELARDLAMQVASLAPRYVGAEDVPKDVLDKEREIIVAQTAEEKKPPEILAKMVEGRLRKFVDEITLTGQVFVKDDKKRVRDLLAANKAKVKGFRRYEVGEGIEKKAPTSSRKSWRRLRRAANLTRPADRCGSPGAAQDAAASLRDVLAASRGSCNGCAAARVYGATLAGLSADSAEVERRSAARQPTLRHRPRRHPPRRHRDHRSRRARRPSRPRDRRRQHLSRRRSRRGRHGPRHRRSDGHARDGHQFPRDARRSRAPRRPARA